MLEGLGFSTWITSWIRHYLHGRSTELFFDDHNTQAIATPAGVPQDSPLSPIPYILFTTPLFRELHDHAGVVTIGYADDANLNPRPEDPILLYCSLEGIHTARDWARRHGMMFSPVRAICFTSTGPKPH